MTTAKKIWLTLLLVVVAAAAAIAPFGINYYVDHKRPNFRTSVELYVYPDTPVDSVAAWLDTVVLRPRSLGRALREVESIEPGHYSVSPEDPSIYVARMLDFGWQTPIRLTLSGTLRQKGVIARKIANQMMLDSATVARALDDKELLAEYGFTPQNVFAMLIPDTYEMFWTDSIGRVLDVQKAAYDAFWTEENKAKAKAQGLTQMEVSILASIVKGETNYEPEMPAIAAVYLNRLRKGMKLQADPTIAYCYGYTLNRILRKHLTVDSPYNTYKHAGLPPGPIYVPTKACLEAVLNPDQNNYLFFCASPDFNGSHRFAATYSEHLKNARAFQKALNERNKKK